MCGRHFDAVQRDKEMEIVQKLLNEERRLKRQQEKLSKPHWQTREVAAAVGHGPRKVSNFTAIRYVCVWTTVYSAHCIGTVGGDSRNNTSL